MFNCWGATDVKFWPQKRWKKIMLTSLLVALAVLVGLGGYLEYSVYREVASPLETLNPSGAKSALVVYHPGLTDFAQNITYTYAEALAAAGWRVDITTVSAQTPTDLSSYSLLVLNWAIYDFNPAPTMTNYIHRLGDLNNLNTTIITISGGMDPLNAKDAMNQTVKNAHGNIVQSLSSSRSNRDFEGLRAAATNLVP
jgi:hypothetical protein